MAGKSCVEVVRENVINSEALRNLLLRDAVFDERACGITACYEIL